MSTLGTIFTVGYERREPEELVALVREHDAVVVDVRRSAKRGKWRAKAIEDLFEAHGLGERRYQHLHAFGNEGKTALWEPWDERGNVTQVIGDMWTPWYRGGMMRAAFEAALTLAELLCSGRDVILLCKERNVDRCHRKTVATFVAIVAGIAPEEVIHLG